MIFDNGEGVAAKKLNANLLEKFEKVSQLPQRDIEAVNIILEGVIVKNQLADMVATK